MTEVAFHFNAPDRLAYACRLLRKAVGSGARVVVTGEGGLLRELDTTLWTFAPLEFVPHCHSRAEPAVLAPVLAVPNMMGLFAAALVAVPFVRPWKASRLLLTYAVPAIPVLFAWDGMVSGLRAYTPEELLELARSVRGSEGYAWKAERGGLGLCLIGHPTR